MRRPLPSTRSLNYLSINQSRVHPIYLSIWRRVLTTVRRCTPQQGLRETVPPMRRLGVRLKGALQLLRKRHK